MVGRDDGERRRRLRPGRIPIPDLVLTTEIDFDELVVDATAVRLVCEILSPSNAATDRVLKMHYYAAAGIPYYLLADPHTGALALHGLGDGSFQERAVVKPGELLRLTEPVRVDLDPADLLPPR